MRCSKCRHLEACHGTDGGSSPRCQGGNCHQGLTAVCRAFVTGPEQAWWDDEAKDVGG